MNRSMIRGALPCAVLCVWAGVAAGEPPRPDRPAKTPNAVADLRTLDGAKLVAAKWRYADASIVPAMLGAAGPSGRPTGEPRPTMDISPKPGTPEFESAAWAEIGADSLETRRTAGRLAMGWYRLDVTIPEKVGAFATAGSVAVLELTVDDYAEVWVDGKLPTVLGQRGGVASGWNAPQRIVLDENAAAGRTISVAVFAANAPLSSPPMNYVWVRSATLDFYDKERLRTTEDAPLKIERMDPRLDAIVKPDAKLEKLAGGFTFVEGPVWVPRRNDHGANGDGGFLLFSEPDSNVIHRWQPIAGGVTGMLSIYRTKSGYAGADIGEYRQAGSNGLAVDPQGRIVICEHGNRRVGRLEPNGMYTVLADRWEGKKLNSPNDLVVRSDGTVFFTDPPFGLPKAHNDPKRETPHFGVYSVKDGGPRLLSTEFTGPNGIALSPDEKTLYVGNWDDHKKVVFAYDVTADGGVSNGRLFHDFTPHAGEDAIDGVKTDAKGNVYVSGPGGLWILDAGGAVLGAINGPEHAHNFCFGDDDGKSLYLCARGGLYRLRTGVGK